MTHRSGLLLAAAAGLALCSCSNLTTTQPEARKQAEQRWDAVRGKIKLQLASESFRQGNLDEAQKQLTEAEGLDPTLSGTHVLRTRILLERGEIAAAQESLYQALSNGAAGAETHYLAGMIAQRYGRFDEALQAYRRAAELEPRQAHYTAAVAEMLVGLDRPAEALTLIQDHWTDFEHNATLRATAGQIHLLLGQYEQAADMYRDAVRIAPEDVTLQYQLGLALTSAGKHAEAVDVLAPLSGRQQNMPAYVLVALGRSYLALNRYEPCRAALRRATEASPDSIGPWSWLARAGLTAGDLVTAREAAARAADLESQSPEPQLLLAYVCLRQGDRTAAAQACRAALRKRPDDPLALQLLDRALGRQPRPGATVSPAAFREDPGP